MEQKIKDRVDEFFKKSGLTLNSTDVNEMKKAKDKLLEMLKPILSDEEYTIAWHQADYWEDEIVGNFYETYQGNRYFGLY